MRTVFEWRASEREREKPHSASSTKKEKKTKLTVADLRVLEGGAEGDDALIVAAWPLEQEEEETRIGRIERKRGEKSKGGSWLLKRGRVTEEGGRRRKRKKVERSTPTKPASGR